MAKCDWILLCDHSFRDENKKVCLLGIFDRIRVINVPTTHQSMALAFKVTGESGEKISARIEILRPSGHSQLAEAKLDIVLSQDGNATINVNMNRAPLPDLGVYAINLYFGDEQADTLPFVVERVPQQ